MTVPSLGAYHLQPSDFSYPLHKQLSCEAPSKEKIKALIKAGRGIEAHDSPFYLTPLHLAAMTGNKRAVKLLIKEGASQMRKDLRGWTALHHAAAGAHTQILKLLMPHNEVSKLGWSSADVQKHLCVSQATKGFWYKEPRDEAPTYYPPEKFRELTEATYVDTTYITETLLKNRWHTPKQQESDDAFLDILNNQLEQLFIDDDKVYLSKTEHAGFGIFARVAIHTGEVFLRYCGVASTRAQGSYVIEDCDAEYFGSLASRANHSFPNTLMHYIKCGEVEEPIFIATEEIAPGEQICVNYGDDYLAIIGAEALELRYEELVAFVQKTCSTKEHYKKFHKKMTPLINTAPETVEHLIEIIDLQNKFHYFAKNRSNQKRLIEEGHLQANVLFML